MALALASAGIKIANINAKGAKAAGKASPAIARPLPFNRPALFSIFTRLIIPKINAGIAVMKKVKKLKIARTRAVMASLLVLAFGFGATVEILVNTQLQEWHSCASSGFSVPHFGQYIGILLSI